MLTKIAYEFEHPHTRFDTYPRLSCNGMLYNAKKRLHVNDTPNTLFDKDESITEIETIRNEIVHNGMWEGCARLFVTLNKREYIERFVLYPDMSGGVLLRMETGITFSVLEQKSMTFCRAFIESFWCDSKIQSKLSWHNNQRLLRPIFPGIILMNVPCKHAYIRSR